MDTDCLILTFNTSSETVIMKSKRETDRQIDRQTEKHKIQTYKATEIDSERYRVRDRQTNIEPTREMQRKRQCVELLSEEQQVVRSHFPISKIISSNST